MVKLFQTYCNYCTQHNSLFQPCCFMVCVVSPELLTFQHEHAAAHELSEFPYPIFYICLLLELQMTSEEIPMLQ